VMIVPFGRAAKAHSRGARNSRSTTSYRIRGAVRRAGRTASWLAPPAISGMPTACRGKRVRSSQAAGPPDLEADVRPRKPADRKLVAVCERGILERHAGRVVVTPATPAGAKPAGVLHECAPGRASGLQNRVTGFDSSHSCFWLLSVVSCNRRPVLATNT